MIKILLISISLVKIIIFLWFSYGFSNGLVRDTLGMKNELTTCVEFVGPRSPSMSPTMFAGRGPQTMGVSLGWVLDLGWV